MPQAIDSTKTKGVAIKLPRSVVLLPPVSIDDLKKDIEHDPEGAEEFVALVRTLRNAVSSPITS
jgi:hypothetical protein